MMGRRNTAYFYIGLSVLVAIASASILSDGPVFYLLPIDVAWLPGYLTSHYHIISLLSFGMIVVWIAPLFARSRGTEDDPKPGVAEEDPGDISFEEIRNWPSQSDYLRAFQNLKFSMTGELAACRVIKNPNVKMAGNLVYSSGNYGLIFKVESDSKYYAIKCFTKGSDLHRKYYMISRYLSKINLSSIVSFEYIDGAVRTFKDPNRYYPVLKMEWVEGDTLYAYVKNHLNDSRSLRSVAVSFMRSVVDMQRHGIAHGDLSNDNIIVRDGNVYFVDYDGMYVPYFMGLPGSEMGHENFQHPKRTLKDFSERLDTFSALVIYTSLYALSLDPAFWVYNGDDPEALIFRKSDFLDPDSSPVFKALTKNQRIRRPVSMIRTALERGPDADLDLSALI